MCLSSGFSGAHTFDSALPQLGMYRAIGLRCSMATAFRDGVRACRVPLSWTGPRPAHFGRTSSQLVVQDQPGTGRENSKLKRLLGFLPVAPAMSESVEKQNVSLPWEAA